MLGSNCLWSLRKKSCKEEGEEEEDFENDEVVEPSSSKASKNASGEKRHFGKARKFQRMMKAGSVPEDIIKLFNDGAQQSKQPRLFKTQLINKLFKQDKGGEYILCSDSPTFQAWKKNVDKTWASQGSVGMPEMVMLWKVFQGNQEAMSLAEAKGQIFEKDGMWHHGMSSAGRKKSTSDQMDLQGGSVDIDVDSFGALSIFLSQRDWAKFGQDAAEGAVQQPALKRAKSQLCLTDAPASLATPAPPPQPKLVKCTWKQLEKTVMDAKSANERLQRDCSRLVIKVRAAADGKLIDKAKSMVALLSENINALNECQMWEQVPNTDGNEKLKVEAFFGEVAKKTEECNENLEELKAVCKARGL